MEHVTPSQETQAHASIPAMLGGALIRLAMRHPKVSSALATTYVLSPLDAMPDFILPPVTTVDDLMVVGACVWALGHKVRQNRRERAAEAAINMQPPSAQYNQYNPGF